MHAVEPETRFFLPCSAMSMACPASSAFLSAARSISPTLDDSYSGTADGTAQSAQSRACPATSTLTFCCDPPSSEEHCTWTCRRRLPLQQIPFHRSTSATGLWGSTGTHPQNISGNVVPNRLHLRFALSLAGQRACPPRQAKYSSRLS